MAQVTEHLGFGVTCTLSYEPPYTFARRMSTLDHLTKGRIGWNIVTGYLDSAAKGSGLKGQSGHDRRYDIADEYMEVVYKLWEGSWEDDAVVRDRSRGIFAQPGKVHRIVHQGENYRVDAIHLCEPSPQRTPVLYQAGASGRGREFAARHAECVFMSAPSKQVVAPLVADIRARAARIGRDPRDILMFTLITVIPGETEAAAKAKLADYRSHISHVRRQQAQKSAQHWSAPLLSKNRRRFDVGLGGRKRRGRDQGGRKSGDSGGRRMRAAAGSHKVELPGRAPQPGG